VYDLKLHGYADKAFTNQKRLSKIFSHLLALGHRRSQGPKGHAPQISNIPCDFVFWHKAVSLTKQCSSLKVKIFAPPKILGWLRYCAWLFPKTRSKQVFFGVRLVVLRIKLLH